MKSANPAASYGSFDVREDLRDHKSATMLICAIERALAPLVSLSSQKPSIHLARVSPRMDWRIPADVWRVGSLRGSAGEVRSASPASPGLMSPKFTDRKAPQHARGVSRLKAFRQMLEGSSRRRSTLPG